MEKLRIDKWLWAIRAFKTRSLATEACSAGKVKINGKNVKPSYNLSVGDEVYIKRGANTRIFKVKELLAKRVGAALVSNYYEDLSPPEVKEEKILSAFRSFPDRDRGAGRPTKKERRDMKKYRGGEAE